MYSLAWLVVVGVIGVVVGGWLGHLIARVRSTAAERICELEAELETARGENTDYRREVFDQFAETARRFKSLDESYNDLHKQLAESASLLCGEAAGPLLEAPTPADAILPPEEAAAAAPAPDVALEVEPPPDTAEQVAAADEASDEPAAGSQAQPDEPAEEDVPILVAEIDASATDNGEKLEAEPSEALEDDEPTRVRAQGQA